MGGERSNLLDFETERERSLLRREGHWGLPLFSIKFAVQQLGLRVAQCEMSPGISRGKGTAACSVEEGHFSSEPALGLRSTGREKAGRSHQCCRLAPKIWESEVYADLL